MLFDNDKTKKSFQMVRRDMTGLKQSVHDWVLYLNTNQRALLERLQKLERRVRELEQEKIQQKIVTH